MPVAVTANVSLPSTESQKTLVSSLKDLMVTTALPCTTKSHVNRMWAETVLVFVHFIMLSTAKETYMLLVK